MGHIERIVLEVEVEVIEITRPIGIAIAMEIGKLIVRETVIVVVVVVTK